MLCRRSFPHCGALFLTASVLFFGSARAKDEEGWQKEMDKAQAAVDAATDDVSRKVEVELKQSRRTLRNWL